MTRILIISDIHYAGDAEQARGEYELRAVKNPILRLLVSFYRNWIWLRAPAKKNYLLEKCLRVETEPDLVITNGDYSCDSGFVGVCDDAAFESARDCLGLIRKHHGPRLRSTLGDHELGKKSLFGGKGGLRLASWERCISELGLEPFWHLNQGHYALTGVASSLVALPVYGSEAHPDERAAWEALRTAHIEQIRAAWAALPSDARIILFCHDPTALPFLWREKFVRDRAAQIERTIIGHLHSPLILWKTRLLRGMPVISFLGNTARRLSRALHEARDWKPFKITLCPSLAGIELLKDGGYLVMELDTSGRLPLTIRRCFLPR